MFPSFVRDPYGMAIEIVRILRIVWVPLTRLKDLSCMCCAPGSAPEKGIERMTTENAPTTLKIGGKITG